MARLRGLEKEFDAVVVTCYGTPLINATLRQISGRVPLLAFINDLPESGHIAYFGPDHGRSRRVAGELMGRFVGSEGGDILLVQGFRAMLNQSMPEQGFRAVIAERFPRCRVVASRESQDVPEPPGEIMLEEMGHFPSIRGIYNLSSGSRSVASVHRQCRHGDRMAYIHELTATRKTLLKTGLIDASSTTTTQSRRVRCSLFWLPISGGCRNCGRNRSHRSRSIAGRTADQRGGPACRDARCSTVVR
ncbi:ABC-type sugar transport system substrate-binding protein [Mesorhizobium shonense]|uniref:ABC-type sugar transport system substrate-binding protein n=1 Tax=Mesorhizobium shonense TaxID=1209948 RepID=A0ABV2I4U4_9HYPH